MSTSRGPIVGTCTSEQNVNPGAGAVFLRATMVAVVALPFPSCVDVAAVAAGAATREEVVWTAMCGALPSIERHFQYTR
jgi:hypothetical protein